MNPPLPLEEAQARLLAGVAPLGTETIATGDAGGRWLAEPVSARRTSPAADLSAMDGFATVGDGPWTIVGESAAGHPFSSALESGQAVRISTGAHVPRGGAKILLREDAQDHGETVSATRDDPDARHIRRRGFDFAEGDTLLAAGSRLGPAQLALAMMGGAGQVPVGRLPNIAIIDSGDELVTGPAAAKDGSIPATNGPMLAALVAEHAAAIERIGPVRDHLGALGTALDRAAGADLIVTTGGASVGDHDLIQPALDAYGATIDFWRVAIRPGKPLLVARKGAQVIIGLPGNPASAFVTAVLFVLPVLRRLAGASSEACLPRTLPAVLAAPAPKGGARREFLRARWSDHGIEPLAERDSSALRVLAAADALIDRPPHCDAGVAGDTVRVIPLLL